MTMGMLLALMGFGGLLFGAAAASDNAKSGGLASVASVGLLVPAAMVAAWVALDPRIDMDVRLLDIGVMAKVEAQ